MSSNFFRIVDFSLLPLSLTVLGKVVGLFVVLETMNIDWGIAEFSGQFFSATPIVYGDDLKVVATFSTLIAYFVLLLVFALVEAALKLATSKFALTKLQWLEKLAPTKLHHMRVYVWLSYLWLLSFVLLLDLFSGRAFLWAAIVPILMNIVLTSVYLSTDVDLELDYAGKENPLLKFNSVF